VKPAPFQYYAPERLDEALALLAEHGDEAKPLAGGQSLVPAMNFRLARPAVLVDLNRIPDLAFVRTVDGELRIGTMTRQRVVERHPAVVERLPLVAAALEHVAHPQIRNRGTFGGSIAHADPASELPAVLLALGGRCRLQSCEGERWVSASELYVGLFETAIAPQELLVEVALLVPPSGTGWAFVELARRHGDYALVGVAALVGLDVAGCCRSATLALFGVGDGPVVVPVEDLLLGRPVDDEAIRAAARAASTAIDPPGDLHATTAYRRHLTDVLSGRALAAAVARARPAP